MSMGNDRWLSKNCFHRLQRRELTGKLPNGFWDYHLQALHVGERVTHLVIADDIICIFFTVGFFKAYLIPYRRRVGEFSPLTDDDGKRIILNYPMEIGFVYYNSNNNSIIIVGCDKFSARLKILSVEIGSIKAGQSNEYRDIYPEEANMSVWDLDIANCRGLIFNRAQRVLKIFDLKEYNEISIIPVERKLEWDFQSLGNVYLLIYFDEMHVRAMNRISCRIYSKQTGELCEKVAVYLHTAYPLHFATLCGDNRICVQQIRQRMQLIAISRDNPEVVTTNLEAMVEPYYLDKLDRFLCYTTNRRLHVCNMRGDILITFQDHPLHMPLLVERHFYRENYITSGQDFVISICGNEEFGTEESADCTINISSIITGECVAKITSENGSQIRNAALSDRIVSLAYDERTGEIFTANEKGICCVWSKNFPSDDRQLPGIPTEDMRG